MNVSGSVSEVSGFWGTDRVLNKALGTKLLVFSVYEEENTTQAHLALTLAHREWI